MDSDVYLFFETPSIVEARQKAPSRDMRSTKPVFVRDGDFSGTTGAKRHSRSASGAVLAKSPSMQKKYLIDLDRDLI
jgi:hypothetical protein